MMGMEPIRPLDRRVLSLTSVRYLALVLDLTLVQPIEDGIDSVEPFYVEGVN